MCGVEILARYRVPSLLLRNKKEKSVCPVGGRGPKVLCYDTLKPFIVLSTVRDPSEFNYGFADIVSSADVPSLSSGVDIVVAQVPVSTLIPCLSKAHALHVLKAHGMQFLNKKDDLLLPQVSDILKQHRCDACGSKAYTFTAAPNTNSKAYRNARDRKNYAERATDTPPEPTAGGSNEPAPRSEVPFPPPPLSEDLSA